MKINELIVEANINQQLSLYHPDSKTYRREKMPEFDPDDIMQRGTRVDRYSHSDVALDRVDDPSDMEKVEKNIDLDRLKALVHRHMKLLTQNERDVLIMRIWKSMDLVQVGKALGLSKEHIRQIESKALRKLKVPPVANTLRQHVVSLLDKSEPVDDVDVSDNAKAARTKGRIDGYYGNDAVDSAYFNNKELYNIYSSAYSTGQLLRRREQEKPSK
jgi:RNA polymerase sigma factor (sigma-70 family)